MQNLSGTYIERYHILEQQGQGGMAVVYKAFDTRLERTVALKIIRSEIFGPEVLARLRLRFEREAKVMASLDHPNIVKIYDYGEYDGMPFLVMDYIQGTTLKMLEKPVSEQEAIRLLLPIANALAHAHQKGILHRDVKPSNILITQSEKAFLTDFGIAKLLEEPAGQTLTGTGVGIGTPEYMAPEQGLGDVIDGRADMYSLAVVFFELLTGVKPFQADTPLGVLYKQLNEPLPRSRDYVFSRKMERVLLKALSKKPEDRFEDMAAFIKVLEKIYKPEVETKSEKPLSQTQVVDDVEITRDKILVISPEDKIKNKQRSGSKNGNSNKESENKRNFSRWIFVGLGSIFIVLITLFNFLPGIKGAGMNFTGMVFSIYSETPTQTLTLTITQTSLPTLTKTITPQPTNTVTFTPSYTPTSAFNIGDTQISEKDGMVMVFVPAGEFTMGLDEGYENEQPEHKVFLDAFWIDQTEVTNRMFTRFTQETGYVTERETDSASTNSYSEFYFYGVNWRNPEGESSEIQGLWDYPVVWVSWNDANVYCNWAERRLPTEAEWEKAARGTDERLYPWGEEPPTNELLNFNKNIGQITAAGYFSPQGDSPYGVQDMAGNVWEWVSDWYSADYYSATQFINPTGPVDGSLKVIRGGSNQDTEEYVNSVFRLKNTPDFTSYLYGFRCVQDVFPEE